MVVTACSLEGADSDCAVPRLSYALLGALALHGLLLLVHRRHTAPALHVPERAADQFLELEDLPFPPTPDTTPSASEDAPSTEAPSAALGPAAPRAVGGPPKLASSADTQPNDGAPSSDVAGPPVVAGDQGSPADAPPARKIDLGLDGHFFMQRGALPPAAEAELGPRVRKSEAQRRLEASLSADDVARGLARGNAFVSSLSSAARSEGPVRGDALLRITVGADGGLLSAELLQGSASEWSATLRSFRELAAKKKLRVPPGAKGMRVTFAVRAKVQRPSGKEVEGSPVGVDTPSLAPNGLVPHGDFDLADLSGNSQRIVYARVVSEEVL